MQEIDRIECRDDAGHRYTVVIYQSFKTIRSLKGVSQRIPGMKEARLSTGAHVNVKDAELNTFEIVQSDTTIRRI